MPIPALIAAGAALGTAAANYYGQKNANRQARADQKKQQTALYKMSQQSQVNSASNTVKGLKLAGLNPALAAGGNFSPVATPSASQPNYKAAEVPDISPSIMQAASLAQQNRIAEKQLDLQESRTRSQNAVDAANADLANANAEAVRGSVSESNAKNRASGLFAQRYFESKLEEARKSGNEKDIRYYETMLGNDFNSGTFTALSQWNGLRDTESRLVYDLEEREFNRIILDLKKNNGAAQILAEAPQRERDYIFAQTRQIVKGIELTEEQKKAIRQQISESKHREKNIDADTDLKKEQSEESAARQQNLYADTGLKYRQTQLADIQIQFTEKQMEHIDQQIKNLEQQLKVMYHNDYQSMMDKGDYGKGYMYLAKELVFMLVRGQAMRDIFR